MPRTALTPIVAVGGYPAAGVTLTWTAADVANLNDFPFTGRELVLIRNSHAVTGYTFTITSAADAMGRTKTITDEAIAAGVTRCIGPMRAKTGWLQTAGKFHLAANNASVLFAIVRLTK